MQTCGWMRGFPDSGLECVTPRPTGGLAVANIVVSGAAGIAAWLGTVLGKAV
jgi:hypothetical protein